LIFAERCPGYASKVTALIREENEREVKQVKNKKTPGLPRFSFETQIF